MTFLAPSFVFVFLPIALSIYALVPKYLKAYSLPAIGIIFYVAINFKSLFALIALPVAVSAVVAAVELYKRKKIRFFLELCRVTAVVSIFGVLALRVMGVVGLLSGVGVVIVLMSATSLCSDVLWGQGRVPDSAWDILVYMTFFPLFMVGPFVKYGDFVGKIDRLDFSVDNFTSGSVSFISGFIKCVAISAVLGEAYDRLFAVVDAPSVWLAVLLIFVRGIGFFTFLSGYSDIAVGIAAMFGIRVSRDHGNFFCNVTPCEFIRNFCSGLLDFCRSYITVPVSLIVSGVAGSIVASVFAAFFYVLVFSNDMEKVYTLMPVMTAAMLFIVLRTGKRRRDVHFIPKILGCAVTLFVASSVVWYIYFGTPENTASWSEGGLLSSLSPRVFEILGDVKYAIVPTVAGLCIWAVRALFQKENAYLDARQSGSALPEGRESGIKLTAKYFASAVLLAIFVFTLIMILPQYPYLASANYFFPFV